MWKALDDPSVWEWIKVLLLSHVLKPQGLLVVDSAWTSRIGMRVCRGASASVGCLV